MNDDIDLDILFGDENSEPDYKVNVNSHKGKTEVINKKKTIASTSFKNGSKKIFNKDEKQKLYDEILNEYEKMHPNISTRQHKEISERITRTVDPSIYLALAECDKKTETTNKRLEYINIMLKNIRRKPGETLKDYKQREASERNRLLKRYNIDVNYDLDGLKKRSSLEKRNLSKYSREFEGKNKTFSLKEFFSPKKARHLSVKGFASKEEASKIVVPNKKETSYELKEIKKVATKSPASSKKFISGLLGRFKPSKEKLHVTAPKGFFSKLKEKKEKDPEKFKKNSIRALITAGIISLSIAIGYFNFNGNNKNNINEPTAYGSVIVNENETEKTETEEDLSYSKNIENSTESSLNEKVNEETEPIQEDNSEEIVENIENNSTENEKDTSSNSEIVVSSTEEEKDTSSETVVSSTEDEIKETESNYVSTAQLVSTLINSTNIDFDTEFQVSTGTYYETPEGTGNYGNYTKFEGNNLKITYIDVMYEDGKFIQYDASSGLDIASIKKLHPEATISYHVETTDGHILGWNKEDSNNIEACLIKGHIDELKSYIASEDIEYLNTIDFTKENSITKQDSEKIINIIQEAENTRQSELEQQER